MLLKSQAESAFREAVEETGLSGLAVDPWHRALGLPDLEKIAPRAVRNMRRPGLLPLTNGEAVLT